MVRVGLCNMLRDVRMPGRHRVRVARARARDRGVAARVVGELPCEDGGRVFIPLHDLVSVVLEDVDDGPVGEEELVVLLNLAEFAHVCIDSACNTIRNISINQIKRKRLWLRYQRTEIVGQEIAGQRVVRACCHVAARKTVDRHDGGIVEEGARIPVVR